MARCDCVVASVCVSLRLSTQDWSKRNTQSNKAWQEIHCTPLDFWPLDWEQFFCHAFLLGPWRCTCSSPFSARTCPWHKTLLRFHPSPQFPSNTEGRICILSHWHSVGFQALSPNRVARLAQDWELVLVVHLEPVSSHPRMRFLWWHVKPHTFEGLLDASKCSPEVETHTLKLADIGHSVNT